MLGISGEGLHSSPEHALSSAMELILQDEMELISVQRESERERERKICKSSAHCSTTDN